MGKDAQSIASRARAMSDTQAWKEYVNWAAHAFAIKPPQITPENGMNGVVAYAVEAARAQAVSSLLEWPEVARRLAQMEQVEPDITSDGPVDPNRVM